MNCKECPMSEDLVAMAPSVRVEECPESTTPPKKRRRVTGKKQSLSESPEKAAAKEQAIEPSAEAKEVLAQFKLDVAIKGHLLRASTAMQPEPVEGKLPCRDEEQEQISKFLRSAIRSGGSSKILYVSGMPGTGKTASVLREVNQLQGSGSKAKESKFVFVHVNAMCLGSPTAVFGEILRQLTAAGVIVGTGRKCSAGQAPERLTNFFECRSGSDSPVLLLVDEVDYLATRNQAVLYRLFNWLTLSNRLVMTCISNTMDLPERLLPRVNSRFGIVRVDFQPYRRDQIFEILSQRLADKDASHAFDTTALKLCAARVAAGSGDIRKALQLCKRCLEFRMETGRKTGKVGQVGLEQLKSAEKELLHANPSAFAVAKLGKKARLLLSALLLEMRKREVEAVPLRKVTSRYTKLIEALDYTLQDSGAEAASDEVAFLMRRLQAMSVIHLVPRPPQQDEVEVTKGPFLALSNVGLDLDDLSGALQAAEEHPGMLELLRSVDHRG
eukprot:TRINITY_DN491_c0_g1_i2.p1 TRINITY_DN491_c0_g1~~TRINITY_DN491_c0_g1_i2.p1  ORF type:complete len:499 (-),score=119.47 TRINITY_DN491_c0_g1_i2:96-1592(-)